MYQSWKPLCTDLLFNGTYKQPPVDRETFVILAKMASCDVVMSTHDGYYKQIDGLAMGSPPAPHLANGWMSQFDETIKGEATLFARYMDDIICTVKQNEIEEKLTEINTLHPNLKFTIEREVDKSIPFLDMKILHYPNGKLASTWYNKPTDTGLIMNYHALAPKRYKRSVVSGFVYRISNACSSQNLFDDSLEKAKQVLEKNQYPPSFYGPIIRDSLNNIRNCQKSQKKTEPTTPEETTRKYPLIIQYRGKCTEDYARSLHRSSAPCILIMTLRKLKTTMPSLKPPVEKMFRSGVVYKITCSRCNACYVGQTSRHLQTRIKEHRTITGPVSKHFASCNAKLSEDEVDILKSTSRGEAHLLTLEALCIEDLKPEMNIKDEYRSRTLTIKI